jgi:hypothetical protein
VQYSCALPTAERSEVSEGVQYSNPHTSRVDAALVSRRSNSRIEAR